MHHSTARLYQAVKKIHNLEGQSAVAGILSLSISTINHWENVGIQPGDAIDCCRVLGVRPIWLIDGSGSMLDDRSMQVSDREIEMGRVLDAFGTLEKFIKRDMDVCLRIDLADEVKKFIERSGYELNKQRILAIIKIIEHRN